VTAVKKGFPHAAAAADQDAEIAQNAGRGRDSDGTDGRPGVLTVPRNLLP
jgi:hypothetical protein